MIAFLEVLAAELRMQADRLRRRRQKRRRGGTSERQRRKLRHGKAAA